jgi:hypothetical protein
MSVTAIRQDMTGALRARRYRQRQKAKKAAVTIGAPTRHTISTPEMCGLAARLSDGRATPDDLRLADRLIMALVDRLPRDSTIDLGADDAPG